MSEPTTPTSYLQARAARPEPLNSRKLTKAERERRAALQLRIAAVAQRTKAS